MVRGGRKLFCWTNFAFRSSAGTRWYRDYWFRLCVDFSMGIFHCFAAHRRGERWKTMAWNWTEELWCTDLWVSNWRNLFLGKHKSPHFCSVSRCTISHGTLGTFNLSISKADGNDGVMRWNWMTFERFMTWSHQSKLLRLCNCFVSVAITAGLLMMQCDVKICHWSMHRWAPPSVGFLMKVFA